MQERSAIAIGGLVLLLLLLPLGYLIHASPRFPGSLAGGLLGIAGAVLMLVPLLYVIIKRVPFLKTRVTRHASMRTLLAVHVYAGVLGPILGMLHAAHKFRSPLGVSLTGMALVVVLTGYVGRYLLARIATAVQGQRSDLAALTAAFDRASAEVRMSPQPAPAGILARMGRTLFGPSEVESGAVPAGDASRLVAVADTMADVESAIRTEEVMRDLFDKWLPLHIVMAIVLYGLLALHVWSGLYYGLRWLP